MSCVFKHPAQIYNHKYHISTLELNLKIITYFKKQWPLETLNQITFKFWGWGWGCWRGGVEENERKVKFVMANGFSGWVFEYSNTPTKPSGAFEYIVKFPIGDLNTSV